MKEALKSQEPKPSQAFRNKYLAAIMAVAALLICAVTSAQTTDSLKYSQINGYGFKYKRMAFDSTLMIPLSTSLHSPYRMGALRYRASDSTLQLWTGYQWNSIVTGVGNGVDTAYLYDDSTLAIETPDQDFFVKIVGRHWNLQGILNNGSTLTENESITISDSLKFILGDVVIDSLRLPSLPQKTDTTANKPLAIDASGNVVKFSYWPGSGGLVAGLNVYNNDSTISSNRTITQAGRYLRFQDGIGYTQFNGALRTIQPDSTTGIQYIDKILPMFAGTPAQGMLQWNSHISSNAQAPDRPNVVFMQGWNLAPGGQSLVAGLPGIGTSFESHYKPSPGDPAWLMEYHLFFTLKHGRQVRPFSWTWNTNTNAWNVYYTTDSYSIKDTTESDYASFSSASGTDRTSIFQLNSGNTTTSVRLIAEGSADNFNISSLSGGDMQFSGFGNINFGNGNGYNVTDNIWGLTNFSDGFNIIRGSDPFGIYLRNTIGGPMLSSLTANTGSGEIRDFVTGGYFKSFYGGNAEVMRASTSSNLLVGQTTDNADGKLQVTGTTVLNGTDANALHIKGSNAGRRSILIDNTDATASSSLYVRNNRASFDTYGGMLTGGSSDPNTLFGLSVADRTFIFQSGGSGTGLGIGTLNNQHVYFGTNDVERMRLLNNGNLLISTTTDNGAKLQVNGDATVADEAYDATAWNGSLEVPTKNAVRDKIESMGSSITSINSQTGPAITIQGGTGTSATTTTNTVTIEVVPSSAAIPHTLDAKYTTASNTGTSETDLFTYTVPANRLGVDGRTVNFEIDGEFNDNTATAQLKLYFAGNVIMNTGAINISTAATSWRMKGYIMRTSSTTAHCIIELNAPGLATTYFQNYSNLTSLDFTAGNIFKISAQAGGAGGGNGDISAHSWQVLYKPQPQ